MAGPSVRHEPVLWPTLLLTQPPIHHAQIHLRPQFRHHSGPRSCSIGLSCPLSFLCVLRLLPRRGFAQVLIEGESGYACLLL